MKYAIAAHTDVGIRKSTNQDSLFMEAMDTEYGEAIFAVLCDGMGGLTKGEVASATCIKNFGNWFHLEFLEWMKGGQREDQLWEQWTELVTQTNRQIMEYGNRSGTNLGTTAAAILLINGSFYLVNVGDSRIYQLTDTIRQLTKDQTVVQQEIDQGNLTLEEAKYHPQRNVLLQCVGASTLVQPELLSGLYRENTVFMICCDGFRHEITPEEFYERMNPQVMRTEQEMEETARYFIELNKTRQEKDNITVGLIRVD